MWRESLQKGCQVVNKIHYFPAFRDVLMFVNHLNLYFVMISFLTHTQFCVHNFLFLSLNLGPQNCLRFRTPNPGFHTGNRNHHNGEVTLRFRLTTYLKPQNLWGSNSDLKSQGHFEDQFVSGIISIVCFISSNQLGFILSNMVYV